MKVLITGGTGFVGQYLMRYLSLNKDYEVFISSRKKEDAKSIRIDFTDYQQIERVLNDYKFDKIFHLACQPSVHISFNDPFSTLNDNIVGTLNLLKACRGRAIKLILAGTSEVYKTTNSQMTEESYVDPQSPYAISKMTIDQFVRLSAEQLDLNITLLRLFNHTGPGQSTEFVLYSFAYQLAQIKKKNQKALMKVGNLQVQRDFTDVRDVVRAYDLVSNEKCFGEVYNVCNGMPFRLSDLLNTLIKISRVSVQIEVDENRLRKKDVMYYCGSYEKIYKKFDWYPIISIEDTLNDLFKYWMDKE